MSRLLSSPPPAAQLNSSAAPVNIKMLESLVGNDPVVIADFLQDFRQSAAHIASQLIAALQAGQTPQACAQAHKLKSSARIVGALELGSLCEQIELAGKQDELATLQRLRHEFEAQHNLVQQYLAEWKAQ